jgi:hypothetical protein
MGCQSNQPHACRWLDFWHKARGQIWLSHVTFVVVVKQQNGDKKHLNSAKVAENMGYFCSSKKIAQLAKIRPIWSRCYEFLNIFAEKFCEKIGVFDSKQS